MSRKTNICFDNIRVTWTKTAYEFEITICAFTTKCFKVAFDNDVDYTFDKIVRNMVGQYPAVISAHIDERGYACVVDGLLAEFQVNKPGGPAARGGEPPDRTARVADLVVFLIVCFAAFTELLNDERFTACLPFLPSCMFECPDAYFNYAVLEYYKTYSSICLSLIAMDGRDAYKSIMYVINIFTTYFAAMFCKSTCVTCDIDVANLMAVFAAKFGVMNTALCMMKDENCRLSEQVQCLETEIAEIYGILKCFKSRK